MSVEIVWIAILIFIVLTVIFNLCMKRRQRNREEQYVEDNPVIFARNGGNGRGEREVDLYQGPRVVHKKRKKKKRSSKRFSWSFKSRSEGNSEPDHKQKSPVSIPIAIHDINLREEPGANNDNDELPPAYSIHSIR